MGERNRREDILQAARVLFREKGYHATTIRDIATQCGLLSGSLYAHIRTKEDLLFEITEQVANQFLAGIDQIVAGHEDAVTKFRNALRAHIAIVADHIEAAAVFSHEWKNLSGNRKQYIQMKRDTYEEQWTQIIEQGIREGQFIPGDVKFSRLVALSVANYLYEWFHPGGAVEALEVANHFADIILRGLQVTLK